MKRILFSCFVLLFTLCFNHNSRAQGNFSITPNPICYNSTGVYQSTAAVVAHVPLAASYTWNVISDNCVPTFTPFSTTGVQNPNNTLWNEVAITIPCCGEYTVTCFGWNAAGFPVGPAFITAFQSGGQSKGVIYCPTSGSITATHTAICAGNSSTLTVTNLFPYFPGGPAITHTWSTGAITPTIGVNPNQNTCYTYTATTSPGCTVSPAAVCVSVQAITATVTPATQTMCAGAPVSFTAAATPLGGLNYANVTTITSYQWVFPAGSTPAVPPAAPSATDNTTPGGTYSVVITHNGPAGTCTLQETAVVTLSTSIPVTITPSSPSVCPLANFTLTAGSTQTLSGGQLTSFTWYRDFNANGNPNVVIPGTNPIVVNIPNTPPPSQFPRTYSVNFLYANTCPGYATYTIGLLTLTPTLTSSAPSTCPGRSLTLTASGGVNYTFTGIPASPPNVTITLNKPTANTATHVPSFGNLPIQYCVSAFSTGCTGTTCIVVTTRTLTPTLTPSTPSICPGTQFTLTASGSGVHAGSTYTFSGYSPPSNIGSGTSSGTTTSVVHTGIGSNSILPQTYTVTLDSAGCQGTGIATIYQLQLQPLLSSPTPSICKGQQLTLVSGGPNGGNSPTTTYTFSSSHPGFDGSPASTLTALTNTASHTPPSSATLITYNVIVDSVGCKGQGTYTVGILNLATKITLTTSPLSGSVCPGSTVTIKAQGALTYTFLAPPTGSFATYTTTVTKDTAYGGPVTVPKIIGSGITYTVIGDSSTCTGFSTITVHEFKIKPDLVVTPTLVCKGVQATLSVTNVGTANPATYYFFVANAFPIPTPLTPTNNISNTVVITPTAPTTYSVLVDSAGCTPVSPPTVSIQVRPDIPLIPSTTAASVCPGMSATLSVAAPTTALSYTYTWSQITGTGQISPQPPNTVSVTAYPFTNSSYSVNVLDTLGCVGNTVISVSIDPSISFPITLASSGSTICQIPNQPAQSVTLVATSTVSPFSYGPINYTWTPVTGLSPSNTGSLVNASPSVTTVYQVVGDNGYGCVSQNTIVVPVGTQPSTVGAITTTGQKICVGFTSTLTAFGANSYTWTGSTLPSPIAQQSVSVGPGTSTAVPATYTVILSNGGGCTNVAYTSVSLTPNFTPMLTQSSSTTCITSNIPKFSKPVHLTASGAGTYVWFPYNPLHMTYPLGPQTDVRPPTTTQYTVIGSTAICSGSNVITVTVIPQFTINVVPPLPAMCFGDSLKLEIVNVGPPAPNPAAPVGPVSSYSYTWYEALNAPPISIDSYFSPTVMVWPSNTTSYTTEVRDMRECVSMPRIVQVTVLPQPLTAIAIPTINGAATNTLCYVGLNPGAPDVTINLVGHNLNDNLLFGVVPTYTWLSPYTPTYNTILTPANNGGVTINAPIRLLNNSSIATYTLISGYNGVRGCRRADTVSVRVIDCRPVRNVKFLTNETTDTICSRSCITYVNLTDTMAGGPQTYTWTFKGGAPRESHERNPTICYNFPGPYDVVLQVSNPYPKLAPTGSPPGSTYASGVRNFIKVVDVPNVTIIAPGQVRSDTTVRFGQSVNLNGSGALTYEWSPAYNISSLTKTKVTVNPFKTTQYILTGYNSRQCFSSDTLNVIVVEDCGEMYVPNAFTPNNDGANDILYVRGICLQSLTFMVFNRWGEKVFETADQSIGWDGTYKGQEMNTGVFVYRLEGKTYDGKGFSSKGNITLLR